MSFIYCHLNFHATLLRPWRFPLKLLLKFAFKKCHGRHDKLVDSYEMVVALRTSITEFSTVSQILCVFSTSRQSWQSTLRVVFPVSSFWSWSVQYCLILRLMIIFHSFFLYRPYSLWFGIQEACTCAGYWHFL